MKKRKSGFKKFTKSISRELRGIRKNLAKNSSKR